MDHVNWYIVVRGNQISSNWNQISKNWYIFFESLIRRPTTTGASIHQLRMENTDGTTTLPEVGTDSTLVNRPTLPGWNPGGCTSNFERFVDSFDLILFGLVGHEMQRSTKELWKVVYSSKKALALLKIHTDHVCTLHPAEFEPLDVGYNVLPDKRLMENIWITSQLEDSHINGSNVSLGTSPRGVPANCCAWRTPGRLSFLMQWPQFQQVILRFLVAINLRQM